MQTQQKAESDLLRIYGRMIAIGIVLVIMAVIGAKYFFTLPQIAARGLEVEHARFLNVLVMVRSQWLSLGKPAQLQLNWEVFDNLSPETESSVVDINDLGWPQPKHLNDQGCQDLWQQLMGAETDNLGLEADYLVKDNSCHYRSKNGDSLGYQLNSGRVIFLTAP